MNRGRELLGFFESDIVGRGSADELLSLSFSNNGLNNSSCGVVVEVRCVSRMVTVIWNPVLQYSICGQGYLCCALLGSLMLPRRKHLSSHSHHCLIPKRKMINQQGCWGLLIRWWLQRNICQYSASLVQVSWVSSWLAGVELLGKKPQIITSLRIILMIQFWKKSDFSDLFIFFIYFYMGFLRT